VAQLVLAGARRAAQNVPMRDSLAPLDIDAIAAETFALLGTGRQVTPFSSRYADFDLNAAYRVGASVHARRMARGERPVGRKVGFTNRRIWAEYGVWAPIWGHVYDTTVHELAAVGDGFSLRKLTEPRIEPEIMFGLGRAPKQGMDDAAVLDCIEWVAHGYEIVQSIFPEWKFAAADSEAAYGLHGALLVGPRHPVAPDRAQWLVTLRDFEIDLLCDGVVADRSRSSFVLDGPISAIRYLMDVLAGLPDDPPLAAGEMITTGTLTRAMAIAPGQTWTTQVRGVALDGIRLRTA
jgi:2-oxo-3-hexenedioate decarboxylase